MNKWYVSIENVARGPFTDSQIKEKLKVGDLSPKTLVYKEGEKNWLPLEEQDIWSPNFTPKESFIKTGDAKDWVLLVENPIKAGDFEQQGPFTEEEVREKIEIGEVHLKDFCWKPGMKDWKSLVDLPEITRMRKEKIDFVEVQKESIEAESLKQAGPLKNNPNKKSSLKFPNLEAFGGELPTENVEGKKAQPLDTMSFEKLTIPKAKVSGLPSVKERYFERRQLFKFLMSVAVVFACGLLIGRFKGPQVVSGLKSFEAGIKSLTDFVTDAPRASYVLLRPSLVNRSLIYIKSDVQKGSSISVEVLSSKGRKVKTRTGLSKFLVKIDEFGTAEVDMSQFRMRSYENYIVKAKIGSFVASTNYKYIK